MKEIVRCGNDAVYAELQQNVANGKISQLDINRLEKRVLKCPTENDNELYASQRQIMITRTHKAKDEFNKEKLNLLEGEPVSFVA